MKKLLFYLIISSLCPSLFGQIFNAEQLKFPGYYRFRGELSNPIHASYASWIADTDGTNGIIRKFICEEQNIKPGEDDISNWIMQSETQYPNLIKLIHWNGRARRLFGIERNSTETVLPTERYFPGHWAYRAGATLTQSCTASQTTLYVNNASRFSATRYTTTEGDIAIMVKLDNAGNKLWNEAEMVQVTQVNTTNNTITVIRNKAYTNSSFEGGKTYIAPVFGTRIIDVQVWYNHSSNCPKDNNGKTAADLNVDELSGYLLPGGFLEGVDGIAFDVTSFDISNRAIDSNNDGISDGGWINGENTWMAGHYKFLKDLRTSLGSGYILTADGHNQDSQRAVGALNGMESEGLVQFNDAWRGISRTINAHLYWLSQNADAGVFPFGYSALKTEDANDDADKYRYKRFGVGVASCLGIYVTWDPADASLIVPAWLTNGSLGAPTSNLIRYAKKSPDVMPLSIGQVANSLSSTNCNISLVNNEIMVTSKSGYTAQDRMTLTLPNVQLPSGDVTFFVEAQSIDPLEGMTSQDRVPRDFELHISGLPNYGYKNSAFEEIHGFMGTSRMEEMSFYYRRPGVAAGPQTITFSVQGRGAFKIKSIKVYNEADILIRSFENGVVLANPSFDNKTIDMATVFPGQLTNIVQVPNVNSEFLQVSGVTDPNLSLDELPLKKNLKIYPNPSNDRIYIKMLDSNSSPAEFKIYTILGKLVYENKANYNGDVSEIDVSKFASGVYIFEIKTDEHVFQQKVVIN